MSTEHEVTGTNPAFGEVETANDRFKRSFGSWFWGSMIAAVAFHFALLAFWPTLNASDVSFSMDDMEAVALPPEIEIPPPPEQIQRPATPVVSDAVIDDITMDPTTFDDNPPDVLPPPPPGSNPALHELPQFTPHTVKPEVLNRPEIRNALEREYPPTLRDAGIGGTVVLHFFIDATGVVQNTVVFETSGHAQLDAAAQRVARMFRFSPALNQETRVPVWIAIPVAFETR